MMIEIVPAGDASVLRLTATNGHQFRLQEGSQAECEAALAELARACEKATKP